MVKLEFYLRDEDMDRLWFIKEREEKESKTIAKMSGGEFARDLLERKIYQLCPKKPKTDENGNYVVE